jgi:polyisoprenoid-binding protein YceI
MKKLLILGSLAMLTLVVGGAWLWNWALGDTEEASAPIVATPIEIVIENPTPTVAAPQSAPTSDAAPTLAPSAAIPTAPAAETPQSSADTAPAAPVIFAISQADSQASFTIYEELRGQPKNVLGVTDQVAGEIALNASDLSSTQVGAIQVNARTLATDDDRRNQAIRNRILFTDSYEFITFTPTAISGLSGGAAPGQTFEFQITGDLTIRDVTQEVVFNVSAQMVSEGQISGTATAVIQLADFNLAVPNVPFVANVGQEVTLEVKFVANAAA